jgi:hypothetical protein
MTGRSDDASERFVVHPPAELSAVVRTAAVPDIPFASFASALQPVHDGAGNLVDWLLTAAVLDAPPTRGASVSDYWEWRRCWEQRMWLGPVTNVAALVTHVRRLGGGEAGLLDDVLPADRVLAGDEVDVVVGDVEATLQSIEAARQLVAAAGGRGLGFVDDTPRRRSRPGLARTWPPVGGEELLAAAANTRVVAGPETALSVVHQGANGLRTIELERVDFAGDQAVLVATGGDELRIDQLDARPLAWLVPGALRWHVRPVALVTVWAAVFDGLSAALSVAAAHGGLMRLTTSSPLG